MAQPVDFEGIAKQFVTLYYQTFDTNREGLAVLYRDSSYFTYESASVTGLEKIGEKLLNLPFQNVKHEITTIDPMPGLTIPALNVDLKDRCILIQVTGFIIVDGDEAQPFKFAQTFQLVRERLADGSDGPYYVSHDIFKLIF